MWIKRNLGKYFLWYNWLLNIFPLAVDWFAGKACLVEVFLLSAAAVCSLFSCAGKSVQEVTL